MKLTLNLGLKQHLTMTPKLQQAIKLLHLSANEIEEEIQVALDTNPVLERIEYAKPSIEYSLDNIPEPATTLREYLSWQMNLTPFTPTDREIAMQLIDAIDDDGYLQATIDDIQTSFTDVTQDEIIAVLHRIQQFDPIGVGSRNLQECLLLQTTDPLCREIIANHLDLVAQKKYAQIKKSMLLNDQELAKIITTLTNLNPRPGSLFQSKKSEYIIPDVLVTDFNEQWIVSLNPEVNTTLRINTDYAAHMREQYQEAKWLLHSLQTRNETLLKVAGWIVKFQAEFLRKGAEYMHPLRLRDIATDLGINESTVSRICTNKYLHTSLGTFELKYFFSSQVGDRCSSTAIKSIIKDIVGAESHVMPYSDEDIRKQMANRNILVARRTIAKYREALGILPSAQRKTGV